VNSAPLDLAAAALADARSGAGDARFADLASLTPCALADALPADDDRLAFWLNIYNAAIQRELRADPGQYRHRGRFFARRGVTVAGRHLSFNAIEHGILRRSQFGYGLGYLPNPLPGAFERRFRLSRREPRVHFALNCGAVSCPPVAAYNPATVREQLQAATSAYLAAHCHHDPEANTLTVPRLLLWFRGDFGGARGIHHLLSAHALLPAGPPPRIRYEDYDWTLKLD
jgi:hypothetical protein